MLPALVCIELNNGSGSGILVSEKGLVFSAAHVVDKKGTTLKIILPDGTRLPGKTTAQNSNSDAGMAKITSQLNKKLPCVEKAEKMPRVGDWVFALGTAGGWTGNAARWCAWGGWFPSRTASFRRTASDSR